MPESGAPIVAVCSWTFSCHSVPHNKKYINTNSSLCILRQESFWWWECSVRQPLSSFTSWDLDLFGDNSALNDFNQPYPWSAMFFTAVDECESSPCSIHGLCENQLAGFQCRCQDGWSGSTCNQPPDACYQHQCQNGATCVPGQNSYDCLCPSEYSGVHCHLLKGGEHLSVFCRDFITNCPFLRVVVSFFFLWVRN